MQKNLRYKEEIGKGQGVNLPHLYFSYSICIQLYITKKKVGKAHHLVLLYQKDLTAWCSLELILLFYLCDVQTSDTYWRSGSIIFHSGYLVFCFPYLFQCWENYGPKKILNGQLSSMRSNFFSEKWPEMKNAGSDFSFWPNWFPMDLESLTQMPIR